MGRRSTFDAAFADRLLSAISDGASLTRACQDVGVPRRTVRQWLADNPEFARQHAAAVQMRLETLADEVVDILDEVKDSDSSAQVAAARNRAEGRRWLLSKVLPATYGDRVELTGAAGEALTPAYGPAMIPQLMAIFQILEPKASNAELHHAASMFIERAASLTLPAPGGKS